MKVFISSLITGMEAIRAGVREAIIDLGHEPVMAEDFGALPSSPQVACLDGLRRSAAVVLILGARYGAKQSKGLSATHEEYREACNRCPILAFVEDRPDREPDQKAFVEEVQSWNSGLIRDRFPDAKDLQKKVTKALHRMEVVSAAAPFDPADVLTRAIASLPDGNRSYHRGSSALNLSIAGGPSQTIIRPSELENPSLAESLEREALFGSARIFERGEGVVNKIDAGKLVLEQEDSSRLFHLDGQGGILIVQPVNDENSRHSMPVIILETVKERLTLALRFSTWVLELVDPTQRLSHVVVACSISGGLAMMRRQDFEANPHSISMSSFGNDEHPPIHLSPPHMARSALGYQLDQHVDDLATLLYRQWR